MAHKSLTRPDRLARAILERDQVLKVEQAPYLSMWQNIARYVIPRSATFTEEVVPGVERTRYVLDSTAPRSLELFASFIHTLLNNPALQWFWLRGRGFQDKQFKISKASEEFLEKASKQLRADMTARNVGLYSQLHQVYIDLGAFGTAILFLEVVRGQLRIRAFHLADCRIAENEAEQVDTLFRDVQWTPRQVKQRFDPNNQGLPLGSSVDKATGRRLNEKVRFLHAVFPISETESTLFEFLPANIKNSGFAFASVWVNAQDNKTVGVGVFEEFPYMVPRWYKVRGEVWGRSPAMTVMPDIRMVNRMSETILRGAEKIVDPPLFIPDGGLVSPIRLFPGGITFTEGKQAPQPLIPPGASRIEVGSDLLALRQQAIREGFFVPLFITPESPVKTATQVLQETDERNRSVSPMLVRTQEELHTPFIFRAFNMELRSGRFGEPPQELLDSGVDIEYDSPLYSAQVQNEALSLLRTFEQLSPWAQVDPGVFARFEPDEIVEIIAEGTGVPKRALRSRAKAKQFLLAQAEQEQAREGFSAATEAVEASAKLTSAQKRRT